MTSVSDKVTLKLDGNVPLDLFATAISGLNALIEQLAKEVASDVRVDWLIDDLSVGSAMATIVGVSEEPASVERVVNAYERVAIAVARHEPIPFSESVRKEVGKITGILNGKVSAITLEAGDRSYTVTAENAPETVAKHKLVIAFGAVEGMVQTLTSRNGLRFTLYDSLSDRAVTCYFSIDATERARQEEMMRNAWEKRVIVQGVIGRDPETDRPIEVRRITQVIPVIGGDYREAGGILKGVGSDELPEAMIRRARDA